AHAKLQMVRGCVAWGLLFVEKKDREIEFIQRVESGDAPQRRALSLVISDVPRIHSCPNALGVVNSAAAPLEIPTLLLLVPQRIRKFHGPTSKKFRSLQSSHALEISAFCFPPQTEFAGSIRAAAPDMR